MHGAQVLSYSDPMKPIEQGTVTSTPGDSVVDLVHNPSLVFGCGIALLIFMGAVLIWLFQRGNRDRSSTPNAKRGLDQLRHRRLDSGGNVRDTRDGGWR